jgi:hypothetical protein
MQTISRYCKGYMGIGLPDLRKCGQLCILNGGCTPYVLRNLGYGSNLFMGETCFYRIMNSELMDELKNGNLAETEFAMVLTVMKFCVWYHSGRNVYPKSFATGLSQRSGTHP